MGLIAKIKEIIFKVKDYDRLESDYCTVLDMVTGARMSKPNYTMDAVHEAFNEFLDEHDKEVYKPAGIEKDATWRPSDEQMNALSVAVKYGQTDDPDALKKLLEQLKAIGGE